MQTRLDRMIQDYRLGNLPARDANKLLATLLSELDPVQHTPIVDPDDDPDFALEYWRQQWAETLIRSNWRFQERLRHYGGELSGNARNPQPSGLSGLEFQLARRDHARGVAGRPEPVALHPKTHHEYSSFNRPS